MIRYSDELIDEIRSSNDIVDVISQYVVLKRSGRNFFGLCPFHKEKSPSFSVSPDKQIFHCFGCSAGGNVFHFISKIEGIDFKESLELLAEKAGIPLPTLDGAEDNKKLQLKAKVYEINKLAAEYYHENLYKPTAKVAQDYIKKRKFDNKTLKLFMIGYAGNFDELYRFLKAKGYTEQEILASCLVNKNEKGGFVDRFRKRIMFPIQDIRGRVIAFGGRVVDDSKPKYINSPETIVYTKGKHLYGLNIAKKDDNKKMIIVEGYMDAISLQQRGITNVVASLGTALTEYQGRLLRKTADQVIISYDSDAAGQTAALRGLEILRDLGIDLRILQMQGAKDPDEFIIKYGSARFEKLVEDAISLVEFKVRILKKDLDIENVSDKIKFLNEIAKILAKVENDMEKEIYIDKISREYKISKEAIYAQISKLVYSNNQGSKKLEKPKPVESQNDSSTAQSANVDSTAVELENLVISYLVDNEEQGYQKIKDVILPEDFVTEINREIIKRLYEQYEKGNINKDNILGLFEEEVIIQHLTQIMSEDHGIQDVDKLIKDMLLNKLTKQYDSMKKQLLKKNVKNEHKEAELQGLQEIQDKINKLKNN